MVFLVGCDCQQGIFQDFCHSALTYANQGRYQKIEQGYQEVGNFDKKGKVLQVMGEPDFVKENDGILETSVFLWKTTDTEYRVEFLNGLAVSKSKQSMGFDRGE